MPDLVLRGGKLLTVGGKLATDPSCCCGACCNGEDCSIQTEADCVDSGGEYQGNGTTCDPNPCVSCSDCSAYSVDASVDFDGNHDICDTFSAHVTGSPSGTFDLPDGSPGECYGAVNLGALAGDCPAECDPGATNINLWLEVFVDCDSGGNRFLTLYTHTWGSTFNSSPSLCGIHPSTSNCLVAGLVPIENGVPNIFNVSDLSACYSPGGWTGTEDITITISW